MAAYQTWQAGRILMGKLSHGADLLEELTVVCNKEKIQSGWITALGAVQNARIAYYAQQKKEYCYRSINRRLEIINLSGNISLKEQQSMVHVHLTLADARGRAYGGHLAPGTTVFACEFTIQEYTGLPFNRMHDAVTGLPLWHIPGT